MFIKVGCISTKSVQHNFPIVHYSNFPIDEVVYNQASVAGATMDKRRGDMREELGYIPPPNRKLPPVPGSQYNTCDRIKRGKIFRFSI